MPIDGDATCCLTLAHSRAGRRTPISHGDIYTADPNAGVIHSDARTTDQHAGSTYGHARAADCTGDVAIAVFAEAFGEGFIPGGAGKIITLPPASEAVLRQPSVDDILSSLEGLPIDHLLAEYWRRLQARDADIRFVNGFADVYGVAPGDQFTDLSADYIRETQRQERGVLELLRAYDRSARSPGQRISNDSIVWYVAMQVRGQAFADYKTSVNPVWGLQDWPIDFLPGYPVEGNQDEERYISRLLHLDTWVGQVIDGLESGGCGGLL